MGVVGGIVVEYQIAVIGAGPGGYAAAIRAAKRGVKVCLIEKDEVGGVCLNRGCIPTKAMVASTELYTRAKRACDFGIIVGEVRPDLARIIQRKDAVVKKLTSGAHFLLKKQGVQLIKGTASFLSTQTLLIKDGQKKQVIQAQQIIIAAGTVPYVPPTFGYDRQSIITSDEALKLAKLPRSMVIVGGGVVGCEFASIYRGLGVEVTIVEALPGLLPTADAELGRYLSLAFQKRGIRVDTGQTVEEIWKGEASLKIRLASGDTLRTELVLVAVGRKPATKDLALEKAGLPVDERGKIPVNPDLRTKVPSIYAIGDVNNYNCNLAHAASHQGLAVVDSLYGQAFRVYREEAVPNCLFTDPEIAWVGLTIEEAQQRGLKIRTGKLPYLANGRAVTIGETEGWVKIIANEENGRILGVHIVGAHASELIAEATLAVRYGLTTAQLAETVHAHPTLAEAVMEAAEGIFGFSTNV